MNSVTLIFITVFTIVFAVSDRVVNQCTNTAPCRLLGTTCTSPSDINSCVVVRNGTNYACNNPPVGFGNPLITCSWTRGCTSCRPNARFSTLPDCVWDIL